MVPDPCRSSIKGNTIGKYISYRLMHVLVSGHLTNDILYRNHSLDGENITQRDQSENVQITVDIKYDFPGVICQNNSLLENLSIYGFCLPLW